jgi:D-methionine transport system substrate-binding protein
MKKKMKRLLTLLVSALAATLLLAACGGNDNEQSTVQTPAADGQSSEQERVAVRIGITGEAENDIWAPVIAEVAKEGIDIEIINFADYTLLNGALNDGELDLNAFQHYAFLNSQIADNGYKIVAIGDTYISAMCIYSDKIASVSELKQNDKIAIPNDTVNLGRALSVLQGAGVITLSGPANGTTYEIDDIAGNPLNIEFVQVDAAQIPALLPDVAAGVINGNYAVDFGLSPQNDSIFFDDVSFYPDNRYVNNITAREADKDNPVYLRIVRAYQSEAVEQVFRDKFDGSYLPGWKSTETAITPLPAVVDPVTVTLGVVGEMYQDLWAPAIAQLKNEGITLELVSFADYSLPNEALNNGDIDLNGFQHYAFLNSQITDKGYELVPIGDTIMAAMCIYSDKISDVSELADGDKIAIPNDVVNLGRALSVLQAAGVLKLEEVEGSPELSNIIENPKNIELVEVDAAQVAALLPDVAAGIINGNFAADFGFKPLEDSIFYDDVSYYSDRRFVNIIAARTADADNAIYKRVVAAFQSPETEAVLRDQFTGTFLAAWK